MGIPGWEIYHREEIPLPQSDAFEPETKREESTTAERDAALPRENQQEIQSGEIHAPLSGQLHGRRQLPHADLRRETGWARASEKGFRGVQEKAAENLPSRREGTQVYLRTGKSQEQRTPSCPHPHPGALRGGDAESTSRVAS